MKKLTLILFIILIMVPIFATGYWTVDSAHKQVTAFKRLKTDSSLPAEQVFNIRIVNSNDVDVSYETEIILSEDARGNVDYDAFRYVLYGNILGNINVTFYFGPMVKGGSNNWGQNVSVDNSVKVINYNVEMGHSSSRIGNTLIGTTKRTAATTVGQLPLQYNYCNTLYDFYYADSVTVSEGVSVSRQTKSISFNYNLRTNTYVPDYPPEANVCEFWNRYGYALIGLDVTEDMLGGSYDGTYLANVCVVIEVGS